VRQTKMFTSLSTTHSVEPPSFVARYTPQIRITSPTTTVDTFLFPRINMSGREITFLPPIKYLSPYYRLSISIDNINAVIPKHCFYSHLCQRTVPYPHAQGREWHYRLSTSPHKHTINLSPAQECGTHHGENVMMRGLISEMPMSSNASSFSHSHPTLLTL